MPTGERQADAAPGETLGDEPSRPGRQWFARALLLAWFLVLLAAVVLGERTSSLNRLEAGVSSGDVRGVRIEGGLSPGGRGFSSVEAHWREGLFAYSTEVVQAQPAGVHIPKTTRDTASAVISEDLGDRLAAHQPDLRITRVERTGGTSTEVFGWRVGGWLVVCLIALWAATYVSLALADFPRRATRWAWFWLLWLLPVGPVAFLALGGPTGLGRTPRDGSGRLTGGWAFLITLLLNGVFTTGR